MINFVVALPEEARPVIQRFKLKRFHHISAFPVYGNGEIQLIVSGIGKLAAATATGYLAGIEQADKTTGWINTGIAGSKDLQVGQSLLANKITDEENQRTYYPTIFFDTKCLSASVITVARPESEYGNDAVYDMEAAGFYSAALRFSTAELVHCFKVVSDNSAFHVDRIRKDDVVSLVETKLDELVQLSEALANGAALLNTGEEYEQLYRELIGTLHFSVSQQAQLSMLLQKWFAVTEASPIASLNMEMCNNAKTLLKQLQKSLDALPLSYGE